MANERKLLERIVSDVERLEEAVDESISILMYEDDGCRNPPGVGRCGQCQNRVLDLLAGDEAPRPTCKHLPDNQWVKRMLNLADEMIDMVGSEFNCYGDLSELEPKYRIAVDALTDLREHVKARTPQDAVAPIAPK